MEISSGSSTKLYEREQICYTLAHTQQHAATTRRDARGGIVKFKFKAIKSP